jgi:hypothetical protein
MSNEEALQYAPLGKNNPARLARRRLQGFSLAKTIFQKIGLEARYGGM